MVEGGDEIECVVDSGADASLVSEEWVKKWGLKVDKTVSYHLTGASNGVIPSSGSATISLDFGTMQVDQTCIVIPNFKHGLILGEDFLIKNQVIIDYRDKNLKIGVKLIALVAKNASP